MRKMKRFDKMILKDYCLNTTNEKVKQQEIKLRLLVDDLSGTDIVSYSYDVITRNIYLEGQEANSIDLAELLDDLIFTETPIRFFIGRNTMIIFPEYGDILEIFSSYIKEL